jgi:hypothetical protein
MDDTEDTRAANLPEEQSPSNSSSTVEPTLAGPTTLVEMFSAKGQQLPRRFLAHLAQTDQEHFDRDDVDAVLERIEELDPEFKRLRFLVRVSAEKHHARFHEDALRLARRAIGPQLRTSSMLDSTVPVLQRFESGAKLLAARINEEGPAGRRAFNVLLLGLELLAAGAQLKAEDAVPILRAALADNQDQRPSNPRRARIAQLADPNLTVERMRSALGLIEPWERTAADAAAEARRAARVADEAGRQQEDAERRSAELGETVSRREADLDHARQEVTALRDQLRDVGHLGESDVAAMRARNLRFLQGRLRPLLDTAREAGDLKPPRDAVMRRMVADALLDIEKEIEWLTSSG